MSKKREFDVAAYQNNKEMMLDYVSAALEASNPDVFLVALSDVARIKGMTQLARDTGLRRESLYKTLSPGAKPRFETIMKIAKALGVPLGIKTGCGATRRD